MILVIIKINAFTHTSTRKSPKLDPRNLRISLQILFDFEVLLGISSKSISSSTVSGSTSFIGSSIGRSFSLCFFFPLFFLFFPFFPPFSPFFPLENELGKVKKSWEKLRKVRKSQDLESTHNRLRIEESTRNRPIIDLE